VLEQQVAAGVEAEIVEIQAGLLTDLSLAHAGPAR
jgi:hypothetical protein